MKHVMQEILATYPNKRVLVVGDLMLDEYLWGEVRRISPEAPVPVVEVGRRSCAPGGAANTAANVVGLGGRASLGGLVGEDHHGGILLDLLERTGIALDGVLSNPLYTTTTKTRIIAHSQHVARVDSEGRSGMAFDLEDRLIDWIEFHIHTTDAVVISDYAKGVVSSRLAERVIASAREADRPVVVDPKGADGTKYRGATIVKPNLHEAEILSHVAIHDDASLVEAGTRLVQQLDAGAVLITRGSSGMSLFTRDGRVIHIPAITRDVFDVTGAGDTVTAALAMTLACGAAPEQAAYLANLAASVAVGKVGTTAVTRTELMAHVRENNGRTYEAVVQGAR